jgi:hypothetical protein
MSLCDTASASAGGWRSVGRKRLDIRDTRGETLAAGVRV